MRLVLVVLVALLAIGCVPRDRNTWHPAPPGGVSPARQPRTDEPAPRRFAAVLAPLAIGPLAAVWRDADIELAYELAARIDARGEKAQADGLAAPQLPAADQPAWRSWPVPGTQGADFLLLLSVVSLERQRSPAGGGAQFIINSEVELRAFDPYGNLVFARRGVDAWRGAPSPKFSGPVVAPESEAVRAACQQAIDAFLKFLEQRNEVASGGPSGGASGGAAATRLVRVEIDSEPAGADVLIDGVLRGTTPCTVQLPLLQRVQLRLERSGHRSWERTLLPDEGLRLKPLLERK
ncbi:MAG: PEGA domain-containing protein [Planctomycetota bacterium]|nr:PEGA domain-containing protein [Planctomycetota bacterium]MDW8372810.1 PEGA domain-containing protein [Planctomycetota bacterium]